MQAQKLLAEVIGTFTLIFVGMLAIANNAGLFGVAFAHGIAITVMAMALGGISGGNFNPAVSVGLSVGGYQSWSTTAQYIVAQLIGAALGGFAAVAVAGHDLMAKAGFGNPAVAASSGISGALIAEILTTFFLVLVVIRTAVQTNTVIAGLFIGLTITIGILAVGPESGAALNPARSFGSAIAGGGFANHWVWWVGPIIGAVLAALLANFLGSADKNKN